MNNKIASSGSLKGIEKLAQEYFYSVNIETVKTDRKNIFNLKNSSGILTNHVIIKKNKRYYLLSN